MTEAKTGPRAPTEIDEQALEAARGGVKAFDGVNAGQVAKATPPKPKTEQTRQTTVVQDV